MAPADRLVTGRSAGRHPVAGEHGEENAAEVSVKGMPPATGVDPSTWWLVASRDREPGNRPGRTSATDYWIWLVQQGRQFPNIH